LICYKITKFPEFKSFGIEGQTLYSKISTELHSWEATILVVFFRGIAVVKDLILYFFFCCFTVHQHSLGKKQER
jgi:hypothetical protein